MVLDSTTSWPASTASWIVDAWSSSISSNVAPDSGSIAIVIACGWPPTGAGPSIAMSGKNSPVSPVSWRNHPSGTSNETPNSSLV